MQIKSKIARLLPEAIMPLAQRVNTMFFTKPVRMKFFKKKLPSLTALKCSVAYNKYGGYCVPDSSRYRPAARKILANDVYEPKTIEFMRAHCGDGDIVHAGTYFGDFLPALSASCAPDAKIWAFEPNLENYRCARITLELNGIENIQLTNAGLGAERRLLRIRTADHEGKALGGASRIIVDAENNDNGSEAIQIVTIDEVVGEHRNVSIIQLDVEGYEKEALIGSLKTIQRCRPILILEVLPQSSLIESDWFAQNIVNRGYRKSIEIHGNSVFVC